MTIRLLPALLLLAGPAAGQGPPDGSLRDFDRELRPPATTFEDARGKAISRALAAGDWTRAEKLLLEAIEADPGSASLLRTIGGVFFMDGRPLNAAVAYKKAEAIEPLDDRSRFTLAMAYVALGRRDWARPELSKLEAKNAKDPLYPYWLARLDYDDGRFEAAATGLRRAIDLDPGYTKAHDNLGLCLEALGRQGEALRSFDEAVRLNRKEKTPSPWPPLNLGLLLLRLDRVEEAEARFRESKAALPEFAPARYQLGVALEKQGRLAEAVPELEAAATLDPAYAEPWYALARVYRREGEKSKSDDALARFSEIRERQDKEKKGARATSADDP